MSIKQEFVKQAKEGKILARKCSKCQCLHLATLYFCQNCGSKDFENVIFDGKGTVLTYTIITVPPKGFEQHFPYAWVVVKLTDSGLQISGFMAKIKTPDDLLIGSPVAIIDFDERGIIIKKQ